jgi:S1-C subfamily serine protease
MSYTPDPYRPWTPPALKRRSPTSPLLPFLTLALVLGLLVGGLFLYRSMARSTDERAQDAKPRAIAPRADLTELEKTNIELYKRARPSVVHITTLPDGPAAKAGLRATRRDQGGRIALGDVIVAVDGKPVKKAKELFALLAKHEVGDVVKLGVVRDGERTEVEATLGTVE